MPTKKKKVAKFRLVGLVEGFPGITKVPGVCGGAACIRGMRMPVWILHQLKLLGASDAKILRAYPFLKKADLRNAWKFVEANKSEIERLIEENSW
jgi:uncharacterized protein (DUF433 family)